MLLSDTGQGELYGRFIPDPLIPFTSSHRGKKGHSGEKNPPIFADGFHKQVVPFFWGKQTIHMYSTLPETNIAPENNPLAKEIPIGNHHF